VSSGGARLSELVAQAALAHPGLAHHPDQACLARLGPGQGVLQGGHLLGPTDERRHATRTGDGPHAQASGFENEDAKRLGRSLHVEAAEVAQAEPARDKAGGVLGEVRPARFGQGFHAMGQAHGVTQGGVGHAGVVADAAHHYLARVQPEADREAQPLGAAQLFGIGRYRLGQVQSGRAGPPGVVLMGDGGAEESHDPVARELVDGAFEAVDAVGEDLEEALHDARKKRCMMPAQSSGSRPAWRSIEPDTSAKRTVTCLRSPSNARRSRRIFSARWSGGAGSAGACRGPLNEVPQ